MDGSIDEVKLWDRPLTADEGLAEYKRPAGDGKARLCRSATVAVLTATVDGRYALGTPEGQQIDGPDTLELKTGESYEVTFK